MSTPSLARSVFSTAESIFLVLDPHGGQRRARRNALRALHVDAAASRGQFAVDDRPLPKASAQSAMATASAVPTQAEASTSRRTAVAGS